MSRRICAKDLPIIVCVYKLTNTINGKIYVGGTIDYHVRMVAHSYYSPKREIPITKAIGEFGWAAFKSEILEICTRVELEDKEAGYIQSLFALDPEIGYNVLKRGFSRKGIHHRADVIAKMSETNKVYAPRGDAHYTRARKDDPAVKAIMTARGNRLTEFNKSPDRWSPEARETMRQAHLGRRCTWTERPVIQLKSNGEIIKRWDSAVLATKFFAPSCTSAGNIRNVAGHKPNTKGCYQKTAYGFDWKYPEELALGGVILCSNPQS